MRVLQHLRHQLHGVLPCFQDQNKYVLTERLFKAEFMTALAQPHANELRTFIAALCEYFYRERAFYAKPPSGKQFLFWALEALVFPGQPDRAPLSRSVGTPFLAAHLA